MRRHCGIGSICYNATHKMKIVDTAWREMYRTLLAFKKKEGHCNVRTNWNGDPRLGRWVATQRHRRKLERLAPEHIQLLDEAGFTWAPCDDSWDSMYQEILAFRRKHGTCDVPSHWTENPNLASWVANQRHRRKTGRLAADRVRKLDKVGFTWAIYRAVKDAAPVAPRVKSAPPKPEARADPTPDTEERLYCIRAGLYVQHDGKSPAPKDLVQYSRTRGGNLPPYILLPTTRTVFTLGEPGARRQRRVTWKGAGRLHRDILDYVNENGVLPPHS